MPKLADKDTIEAAYQLWADGVKAADIAEQLNLTIVQVQGWRSVHGWTKRKEKEEVEAQTGAVTKAGNNLLTLAPNLMRAAIELAFNAESESVRATQQRYLLGSLGISPDTAAERIRQLAMQQEKLRQLAEPEIVEIGQAVDVIDEKVNGDTEW